MIEQKAAQDTKEWEGKIPLSHDFQFWFIKAAVQQNNVIKLCILDPNSIQ